MLVTLMNLISGPGVGDYGKEAWYAINIYMYIGERHAYIAIYATQY